MLWIDFPLSVPPPPFFTKMDTDLSVPAFDGKAEHFVAFRQELELRKCVTRLPVNRRAPALALAAHKMPREICMSLGCMEAPQKNGVACISHNFRKWRGELNGGAPKHPGGRCQAGMRGRSPAGIVNILRSPLAAPNILRYVNIWRNARPLAGGQRRDCRMKEDSQMFFCPYSASPMRASR